MQLTLFIGIVLGSYRLTRLVTKDSLFDRQRKWWFRHFPPDADWAKLYQRDISKLGVLVECPWCCGFWLSGLVVLIVQELRPMSVPVLWWLATSSAVGLIAKNLD